MNSEELYDAITDIREDIVEEAKDYQPKNKTKWRRRAMAAAAALVIVLGLPLLPGENSASAKEEPGRVSLAQTMLTKLEWPKQETQIQVPEEPLPSEPWSYTGPQAISLAAYPVYPQSPDRDLQERDRKAYREAYEKWQEEMEEFRLPEGYEDGLEHFLLTSIPAFLTEQGNQVYSPIGTFMTLGMLAETTRGESCRQLLELLGFSDLQSLREKAELVWRGCYSNDTDIVSILANSVWLNDTIAYRQSVMDILSENYYVSSYQGNMESEEYSEMLRRWISEQTGGTLDDPISQLGFEATDAMVILSTIRCNAEWFRPFESFYFMDDVFRGTAEDVSCEFMYRGEAEPYFRGQQFGAVSEAFCGGGRMWFILPDEGVSVNELLQDEEVTRFIVENSQWADQEEAFVHFYMPRFEVSSQLNLQAGLEQLGVTDVFHEDTADFSAMVQQSGKNIVLMKIQQATHLQVDEFGCSAESYTYTDAGWRSAGMLTVQFQLNRPFLFFITNAEGLPIFVGIVEQV